MPRFLFRLIFLLLLSAAGSAQARSYYECVGAADSLINKGMLKEAETTLLEALRAEPDNPLNTMLLSNLGTIRSRMGDHPGALEALDAAVAMTPNSTVARNNRAKARLAAGDYDGAFTDLDHILATDPDQKNARLTRGNVALMNRRPEQAAADFQKILDEDPRDKDALAGMAHALEAQSDFEGAMQYYNRSLAEETDTEILADRALLKIRLGDFRGADEDVHEGLSHLSTDGNLILIRGYLSRLRYRNKDAGDDLMLARKYGADPALIRELFPSAVK